MISFRRQVQDDLSKWENNEAGDPESQADTRSSAYEYDAKIFKVSTPMIKGDCRISDDYDLSDHLPAVLDEFTVDGALWPMPFNVSNPVLYYIKPSFEQSGLDPKTHRFYSGTWRNAFEGSRFGPIEEAVFQHDHVVEADGLVSYLMSQSAAASRPPAERGIHK